MLTYWTSISLGVGAVLATLALFFAWRQLIGRMALFLLFTIALPAQMMVAESGITSSLPALATNLIEYDDSEEAESHRARTIEHVREIESTWASENGEEKAASATDTPDGKSTPWAGIIG